MGQEVWVEANNARANTAALVEHLVSSQEDRQSK